MKKHLGTIQSTALIILFVISLWYVNHICQTHETEMGKSGMYDVSYSTFNSNTFNVVWVILFSIIVICGIAKKMVKFRIISTPKDGTKPYFICGAEPMNLSSAKKLAKDCNENWGEDYTFSITQRRKKDNDFVTDWILPHNLKQLPKYNQ